MAMRMHAIALAALAGTVLTAAPAQAREVTVKVSARAMPWSPAVNRKLPFGRQDGAAPAMVFAGKLFEGVPVKFSATGTTSTAAGGERFGPAGQAGFVTDATRGNSGSWFPSYHADRAGYPAHLNQLIGAFVDADGKVVGKPFLIGARGEAVPPAGAVAITLGINDDIYADNEGEIVVTIDLPSPQVTIQ
ncbi:hypothetical protein [Sphingomonas sp. LM7]|uniref:hypothetical protein n=1 Tax=Sphingomonas sp. LM7 TaxID=1938607 RepID=UPI000983E66E|nr:hypothetical protein [Sphingomonas sp. LM7]AQR72302.1 hypothetical protein BXU08_00235 [Sphingomonas sp. LM7]